MPTEIIEIRGQPIEFTFENEADLEEQAKMADAQLAEEQIKQETTLSTGRALGESLTRGGSLGTSDVIIPALGAGIAKLFGGDATQDMSLEDLFNEARGDVKARRERFREEDPALAFGSEIAASIPTGAGLFGQASKAAQAANLGRAVTPTALAATGAVEGAGLGEGSLIDNREQLLADTSLGAFMAPATAKVFQKAGPATLKTVRKFAETASNPVKSTLGSVFSVNPVAARTFMRENVPISTMALTDSPTIRRIGSILRGTIGSSGVMEKNVENTLKSLEKTILRRATSSGRGVVTPQEAGIKIQAGAEHYIDRFQRVSSWLYERASKFMGDGVSDLGNVKRLMASQSQQFANDPNLLSRKMSNRAAQIAADAIDDAANGGLGYNSLKHYRTEVGSIIKENVISGQDNGFAKQVYKHLTNDMEDLARAKGPKALRAFNNANAFYERNLNQIESRLAKYLGSTVEPGNLVNIIKTSGKKGDFKINAIWRSLPKDDRPVIRDAVLQRLGRGRSGDFIPARFFSDYQDISKEAKNVMFGGTDQAFRQSLDRLSTISKRITDAGKFYNYSESGNNLGSLGLVALAGGDVATGGIGATSIVTAGGLNLSGRLLTNSRFAKTLAKHASKPISKNSVVTFTKDLERLAASNPSLVNDVSAYIGMISAAAGSMAQITDGDEE